MTVALILLLGVAVLGGGGWVYSRRLAAWVGEDPARTTPALALADGKDYVATPTPIVFAHHFASIAGAGPIVGPVLAMAYGWLPALIWVLGGGLFLGAVHDYLALYMATRHGGQSVATIARTTMGNGVFVAFVIFLVIMLALVTAVFLNLSASALTSTVELGRLHVEHPGLFRLAVVEAGKAVEVIHQPPADLAQVPLAAGQTLEVMIGGVASCSVIVITLIAPLIGYLYIKRRMRVWLCSVLAILVCGVSILVGLYHPVSLSPRVWQLLLAAYVLVAAGAPVWLFLQSRDFINVHILYVGLGGLVVILLAAAVSGTSVSHAGETFAVKDMTFSHALAPALVSQGQAITGGPIWPMLFITVACGAVSGFHSLCAGGTTCKQITSERAARHVGFYGMLLESFLAVCVIAVLVVGMDFKPYIEDVYPKVMGLKSGSNAVLAFATSVGWAGYLSLGIPVIVGTLGGMILLEGFLVTTLDTAVRLMRYLIEEVWQAMLGRFDVMAAPAAATDGSFATGDATPVGADGIPIMSADAERVVAQPIRTSGLFRAGLVLLRQYWFNSGLAVALMLVFALTGGATALWGIFATANQLLAAMVLLLASLWLLQLGKRYAFALIPALLMLVTTTASLILLLGTYLGDPSRFVTLLIADIVILLLTIYLLGMGGITAWRQVAERRRLIASAASHQPVLGLEKDIIPGVSRGGAKAKNVE